MKNYLLIGICTLSVLVPKLSIAETATEKGLKIATKSKQVNMGWKESESSLEMHLIDNSGNKNIRRLRMKKREVENDGDKSLSVFDEPKDVRGTKFLNFSHTLTSDDQWIYLPAVKRVKRISSRNKSGPFLGSEFAYEDLGSFEVEKYQYKYLQEEPCEDLVCHVLELIPAYENSGYSRLIAWIDTTHYQQRKVDYYDRKNSLLKTLKNKDYKLYEEKYWRPSQREIFNHQNKYQSILIAVEYNFDVTLDDELFSQRGLKRKF